MPYKGLNAPVHNYKCSCPVTPIKQKSAYRNRSIFSEFLFHLRKIGGGGLRKVDIF